MTITKTIPNFPDLMLDACCQIDQNHGSLPTNLSATGVPNMLIRILTAVVITVSFLPSTEASLVVNANALNPANVISVSPGSNGNTMAGMLVTAVFPGGSQTLSWASTGPTTGGVFGAGWSLTSGNTASPISPWTLISTIPLTSLTIKSLPGNTVFDRIQNVQRTAGSSFGRPVSNQTGDGPYQVRALYSSPVGLNSNSPLGDLFGSLNLTFGITGVPNVSANYVGTLTFRADTDFVAVPEPSAITLSSLAILVLSSTFKRRRV